MKRRTSFCIILVICLMMSSTVAFAIDGIWHNPLGYEGIYPGSSEVQFEPSERYPRDPQAGENVYIKMNTWPIESGQATWVTWTKNGVSQPVVNSDWKYNDSGNTYWEANLGSFQKGDRITYTVHGNKDSQNEKTMGPYSFTVTEWDWVTHVTSYNDYGNRLELVCASNSGDAVPKVNIYFPETDYFGLQFAPLGTGTMKTGASQYTMDDQGSYIWVNTSHMKLKINKNPYRLEVYKADGTLITKEYDPNLGRSLAFLSDGQTVVQQVEENFYTPANEKFFGFGQRFRELNKRGMNVDIHTVNWYKDQQDKAYLPVPFYVNTNKYGFYLDSTYYAQFRIGTDVSDKVTIRANAGHTVNQNLEFYIFAGDYKDIYGDYAKVVGKPALPPIWAFGVWMSANEWDTQAEVQEQLNLTKQHNVPTSVIVLEQWSDEQTFYIFNDATYTTNNGGQPFSASDFNFTGKWPNPKQMVDNAHQDDVRLLLWQIPVLKKDENVPIFEQRDNDEAYALANNYVLTNGDGSPYRHKGGWFKESLTPDFTNQAATNWWLGKRDYLIDDLGFDGFKCDGGEFVWGRNTTFSDGSKADEMRNVYPDLYVQTYYDYLKNKRSDTITFSRSGGAKAGLHPITWGGDQESIWDTYVACVRSSISASLSGVPFVAWDLAGFSGDIPSTELYKRSITQGAFSPIMQIHSEKANPSPSQARTPWNMVDRTGDQDCLNIYRKFANVRMSLIPYLFNEAKYTSETATPMMRHMILDFPNDSEAASQEYQYMLGGNLLVAPVMEEGSDNRSIYLPEGEWVDFWWGAQQPGQQSIDYHAGLDSIPVFVKAGSILPMNLNADYDLGGTIGNDLDNYNHLTFRIFPEGTSSYDWFDYVSQTTRQITVVENDSTDTVTVQVPDMPRTSTLQVFASKPQGVTVDGGNLTTYTNMTDFKNASSGWYYDTAGLMTYVKLASSTQSRNVVLNGVNKASYEAEYATHTSVTTNNNHDNYYGTGFVDGFAESGDAITFDVWAESGGTKTVDIRYCAGASNGQRSIYVNGTHMTDVALAKTSDWDTWNTVTVQLLLNQGKNTIKLSYDQGDYTGINVDHIVMH
ncbi:carbohydrate-binding protein [Vallitalea pronyensis]|uniref:Carbohydrate-binding protein n=1 Tax=Vallitalea pronyensis TaxID=1348613 RepID=A0A8J8MG41_9FIRM|nr:TIM-barrel domain-containing protein [Vallitalea pronyensis]QUI20955.1 carbohydrate-binding protein [Vallitalea pronyensis]